MVPFYANGIYFNLFSTGVNQISTTIGGSQYYPGFGSITLNTWTYLAVEFNGTALKTYNNGILTDTRATTGSSLPFSSMYIGNYQGWWLYFNGTIDEVRIYNRAIY
jgi:hypothetical protein